MFLILKVPSMGKALRKEIEIMEIGSKIRNARNEAGYTQERAAEALGVSRQTISNWENGRSYPDIVSVIRMSGLYSVSLDHLLKEEETMKDTYTAYLEESTNIVKSRDRLTKAVLIAAAVLIYAITQVVFWLAAKGPEAAACTVVFQYISLPAAVLLLCVTAGKNNWWGKGKWVLVAVFAVLFLLVPSVTFVSFETEALRTFLFPNFKYAFIGFGVSLLGLLLGDKLRQKDNRSITTQNRSQE